MKEGWEEKRLGDVCEVFLDGDWIESKDQSSEGIRLVQTGNIGLGEYLDKKDKSRFISEETFNRLKCTEVFPGDLLVSRLPQPVGRSCIVPEIGSKMITSVDCTIIRPDNSLLAEFLKYFQISNEYFKDIDSKVTGTTRSRISRKNLGLIKIPIPPLSEQKEIVAKLDEAFAAIDLAKANIEKNIGNARELFQSRLNDHNFPTEKLEKLVDIKTGKLNANAAVEGGKYPFFTCSRDIFQIDKYAYDCEAILLAGNNAVGDFNVKHYKGKFEAYQRTYIITAKDESKLNYRFLYFQMLNSLQGLKNQSVGTGTKFLKLPVIKAFKIAYPNIDQQNRFVENIDSLLEKTEDLVISYNQKLTNLEELKKSLLQKAFAGELT